MDFFNISESLLLIKPELALSIFLVLIVTADLIFGKKNKLLPYIGIAGLVVTLYFVIEQFSLSGFAFYSDGNRGLVSVDSFGAFFKIIILFASVVVVFFSISSVEVESSKERHGEYYALLYGMILGMFFMVSASDLILMYLSLELVSLSSYVLAGFTKTSLRNSEASLKYIIYGGVSSGIMLFGISILFGMTGSTNLYEINSLLQAPQINTLTLLFSGILIFTGIGFKISAAPFHFWTPDVYEGAPITITAFLSVASKAAGFGLLIRFIKVTFVDNVSTTGNWTLLPIFQWQELLIIISILTMTLGNFAALWQDNLKRMLAYSSIAHAGYMLMGIVVLSNQGMMAIMVYFIVYALMNLGAFLIIMLFANKIGSEEIDDYRGLGYASPFLGVSLTIFLISLVGIPPTAGFIGKLYLFIALIDAKMVTLAIIALLNTVVSLYYYVRILKHMFLSKSEKPIEPIKLTLGNYILVLVLLVPTLLFGLYFAPIVNFAKNSISILGF